MYSSTDFLTNCKKVGNWAGERYDNVMSAAEIISELPKLTELDRRAIRQMLLEIACRHEDIAACNQAETGRVTMFHRMEEEDARRFTG